MLFRRLWTDERGDLIVTPAILIMGAATVLVLGGLAFAGARMVAPGVANSRQGVTIDDDGNVVQGAVGVAPMEAATPEPTPTKTPRIIVEERVEQEPEPQQTQSGGHVVVVTPDDGHDDGIDEGETHTSNSGDSDSSDDHPQENCCENDPPPDDGGH